MSTYLDQVPNNFQKSKVRGLIRNQRREYFARLMHVGRELSDLEKEEVVAKRTYMMVETVESVLERATALEKCARVLDTIRDRRRILLGEPLPSKGSRGRDIRIPPREYLVDVSPIPEPQSIPQGESKVQGPAPGAVEPEDVEPVG